MPLKCKDLSLSNCKSNKELLGTKTRNFAFYVFHKEFFQNYKEAMILIIKRAVKPKIAQKNTLSSE
jgi:hypothetical protein